MNARELPSLSSTAACRPPRGRVLQRSDDVAMIKARSLTTIISRVHALRKCSAFLMQRTRLPGWMNRRGSAIPVFPAASSIVVYSGGLHACIADQT